VWESIYDVFKGRVDRMNFGSITRNRAAKSM